MAHSPKISFSDLSRPQRGTLVLLAADKGKFGKFAASVDKAAKGAVARAMQAAKFTGKKGAAIDIWAPAGTGLSRIIVFGIGKKDELEPVDWLNFGGQIMAGLKTAESDDITVALENPGARPESVVPECAADLAMGLVLRAYSFDRYKSRKKDDDDANGAGAPKKVTIAFAEPAAGRRAFAAKSNIADGVLLARELVDEPANTLGPKEFAARAKALSKLGVKVEILTEAEMKRLKMAALLGVAQGSVRPPRLVVMRWDGARSKATPPVAFIGKGVVFDTGGISIKPAGGMEDMKGDMGGAAAVTGLMMALAGRKAKANVIGVIGLVENMPDGNAQRPGDIVRSMSGQTIEVINTDAEGRLVLADALWYTQKRFKPQFMIDLATLTGAIMVALGKHHAGLFSNNDELAGRLHESGQMTGEKVWRMPMGREYDKLIDSKNADMKNVGGRYGGSITAAQFLARFVNEVPWAHLDIAGTAMGSPATDINTGWASGFGVRLLDRLVADHYEK